MGSVRARIVQDSRPNRQLIAAGAALLMSLSAAAAADSVVRFNEIMFRPTGDERRSEWLELRNGMSVDVDISGWRISGGIDFRFPEGTVVRGGDYIVVAASPEARSELFANVPPAVPILGPFSGRLSNSGDELELRNNNDRLMDSVEYGVDVDWPVGPNGTGASLGKRDEDSASELASSWATSATIGGTPGRTNFPAVEVEVSESTPVRYASSWRFTQNAEAGWAAREHSDGHWAEGLGLFGMGGAAPPFGDLESIPTLFSTGLSDSSEALAAGAADPHYFLTQSAQSPALPSPIPATVIQNHPAWVANDAESRWLGPVNPGTQNVAPGQYVYRTSFNLDGFDPASAVVTLRVAADNRLNNVLLNGASRGIGFVGFAAFSQEFRITNGFQPALNTLDFITANDTTSPNPAGFRAQVRGVARKIAPVQTVLPGTSGPVYFRSQFNFAGSPGTAGLQLRAAVADGAVFYLNGAEVFRWNMPDGPVDPATRARSNMVTSVVAGPWSIANTRLTKGTNVLAVEVHPGPEARTNLLFGAELTVTSTNGPLATALPIVFNEIASPTASEFWLELINTSPAEVELSGCALARQGSGAAAQYRFPAGTLAAGGLLQLDRTRLGFGALPGDRLFLVDANNERVLDAVVVKSFTQARWPNGFGAWAVPAEPTPGALNRVIVQQEVVINEIMYHPPASDGESDSVAGTWLELFNRSTAPVDLGGWRLDGSVRFTFPPGAVLPGAGYLVVAKDAGWFRGRYPAVPVAGPFAGRLGRGGGRVRLLDAAGNVADEVEYHDDKPWPRFADGGGASLELRDPFADNARAEAWASSVESNRSAWSNYTYRAVAAATLGPTLWKEFVIGLLDTGECLIDDLRVTESPATAPVAMLQNTDFESGLAAWRALGNHSRSRVEPDPDDPANHVLHLVATGPTEHMHNHLETTLANGRSVVNGREYEVSFRARWLAGNPRLNTRLYFNRVARTTALAVPTQHGTPGERNSVFTTNIGPTFRGLSHEPVLPKASDPVRVRVSAQDPDGLGEVVLWWSPNGQAWRATAMSPAGDLDGGDRLLETSIPPQPAGTLVHFYVEATDGRGARAAFPAGGRDAKALFKVAGGQGRLPRLHDVKLLMTSADVALLHARTNVMSDDRLGATLIYDDRDVFYDVGLHLQGSERGRDNSGRVGYSVRFNSDRLFRGVHESITLDRSGGYSGRGGKHDELLLWHAVNHAGGIPGIYCDLVQCWAPRAQEDGTALLRMAAFDGEYFDAQFENGGDGNLFKLELVYYPTTSVNGTPQAPKLPQPDEVINVDIQDRGDDPENYRWIFLQENHADQGEYRDVIALNKAFSVTGPGLESEVRQRIDVEEWMRTLAFKAFTGDVDTFTYGLNHNWMIYFRPEDGRALGLLWDMDFSFAQSVNYVSPGAGSPNMNRITRLPNFYRRFYAHLLDLSNSTVNSAYLQPWAQHYAGLVGQDWSDAVTFLQQRAEYLRRGLPLATPFAITSNGGGNFGVATNQVTLSGTAPLTVDTLRINGLAPTITWRNLTNWTLTFPLAGAVNRLEVQGVDMAGRLLANFTAAITVTNTAALPNPEISIVSWSKGPDGSVAFEVGAELGYEYQAEFTDDLRAPWQPLGPRRVGSSAGLVFTDTPQGGQRFYRVVRSP